jgi:hypothetical protein
MVASVTDSPSVGTRISAMVSFPPNLSSSAKADDPVVPAPLHRDNRCACVYWVPRFRGT